jgi:hypothetical protein
LKILEEGRNECKENGLTYGQGPLESLESLKHPEGFPNCVLHVLHLGLWTYMLKYFASSLNATGKNFFVKLIQSDLLPWPQSSRLRKLEPTDKFKMIGEDVENFIPYIVLFVSFFTSDMYEKPFDQFLGQTARDWLMSNYNISSSLQFILFFFEKKNLKINFIFT